MTCREIDGALIASPGGELLQQAQEHLASCENCRRLASVVATGGDPDPLSRSLLERVHASVPSSFARVRPLAPAGVFIALFLLILVAIALGGAGRLGIQGWPVMSPAARILIFTVLLAVSVLAAFATARHMRPGARTIRGRILFGAIFLAIEAVFVLCFHDYSTGQFLHAGMGCLSSGLLYAIPAAVLVWLVVRRGYIVAPVSAGCAIGAVAGLTGLFALELHCPILTVPHVAIWHMGVVVVSIALGAAGGWLGSWVRARHAIPHPST